MQQTESIIVLDMQQTESIICIRYEYLISYYRVQIICIW